MTEALRRAFEAAGRLPEAKQDEIAALILGEIEAVALFDGQVESVSESLERMADEVGAQDPPGPGIDALERQADEALSSNRPGERKVNR